MDIRGPPSAGPQLHAGFHWETASDDPAAGGHSPSVRSRLPRSPPRWRRPGSRIHPREHHARILPAASYDLRDDFTAVIASVSGGSLACPPTSRRPAPGAEGGAAVRARLLVHRADRGGRHPLGRAHRRPARDPPPGRRRPTTSASTTASPPPASRPAVAVGSSWDPEMAARLGAALGGRPSRRASPSSSDRASTSSDPRCAAAISSTTPKTRTSPEYSAAPTRALQAEGPEFGEAFRREQPGDGPEAHQLRRRRPHAAGDLPAGIRTGRHRGQPRRP